MHQGQILTKPSIEQIDFPVEGYMRFQYGF